MVVSANCLHFSDSSTVCFNCHRSMVLVKGTQSVARGMKIEKTIVFGLITITFHTAAGNFYPSISFCSIGEDDIHDQSTLWGSGLSGENGTDEFEEMLN